MKKLLSSVLFLAIALLLFGCSSEEEVWTPVGTWTSETGSVTHFYQDSTGKTVNDTDEYEFTWEIISLNEALKLKYGRIREYVRTVYGQDHADEIAKAIIEDGAWDGDDYLIVLTFSDFPSLNPLDFPYILEDWDTIKINTLNMGRILSPQANVELRFEWITLTRDD